MSEATSASPTAQISAWTRFAASQVRRSMEAEVPGRAFDAGDVVFRALALIYVVMGLSAGAGMVRTLLEDDGDFVRRQTATVEVVSRALLGSDPT